MEEPQATGPGEDEIQPEDGAERGRPMGIFPDDRDGDDRKDAGRQETAAPEPN